MTGRCTGAVLMALAALGCSSPEPTYDDRRALDHTRAGSEAFLRGDPAAAALHFERALELARALGDRRAQSDALNNLGIVNEAIGRLDEARALYEAARVAAQPESQLSDTFVTPHWPGVLATNLNLARLALAQGDIDSAASALDSARGAAAEIDTDEARVDVLKQDALVQLARDGGGEAALEPALEAVGLAGGLERGAANIAREADARLVLGRVWLQRGEHALALDEALRAAELARSVSDRGLVAAALEALGDAYEAQGRFTEARERYELALDVHTRAPNPTRARRALERLAALAKSEGRADLVAAFEARVVELQRAAEPPTAPEPDAPAVPDER
jgi:tetratricopeptide (TPR) repeat protein